MASYGKLRGTCLVGAFVGAGNCQDEHHTYGGRQRCRRGERHKILTGSSKGAAGSAQTEVFAKRVRQPFWASFVKGKTD